MTSWDSTQGEDTRYSRTPSGASYEMNKHIDINWNSIHSFQVTKYCNDQFNHYCINYLLPFLLSWIKKYCLWMFYLSHRPKDFWSSSGQLVTFYRVHSCQTSLWTRINPDSVCLHLIISSFVPWATWTLWELLEEWLMKSSHTSIVFVVPVITCLDCIGWPFTQFVDPSSVLSCLWNTQSQECNGLNKLADYVFRNWELLSDNCSSTWNVMLKTVVFSSQQEGQTVRCLTFPGLVTQYII